MKKRKKLRGKLVVLLLVILIIGMMLQSRNLSTVKELFLQDNGNVERENLYLYNESLSLIENLETLENDYPQVGSIIENKDQYPEELLEMMVRNPDMINYVYDYLMKRGEVAEENIGPVQKGVWPLLLQYDTRWGYGIYGDKVLAINGCGPTALAMVVAGLTGKSNITPYTIAKYANDFGYYSGESGTSWNLMTEGVRYFGIKGEQISLSKSVVMKNLEAGHPIICSMRKGDFTTTGHFILLTGVKDGKITVNDSNSKERSALTWTYETLEPQIRNLWAYTLA